MSEVFYLDTARLGQISPSAKRALKGALEFNKAYGASAYFDDFLFGGVEAVRNTSDFDGLNLWEGVGQFKTGIKRHLFGCEIGELVFANRTACFMSLAAKMLFARCRNILVTDLTWDSYQQILGNSRPNESCQITEIKIRDLIFKQGFTPEEITRLILRAYSENECDGLFLPAVCNHGIRLPIDSIIRRVREHAKLRFSVVDAAQAINHIDLSSAHTMVDFIFGGTHKWLRSYEPMAIAYFGLPSSRHFVSETMTRELNENPLADPLTRLSHASASRVEETVNLCPLFAAAGALKDANDKCLSLDVTGVRSVVKSVASQAGWDCYAVDCKFQSRILLLRLPGCRITECGVFRTRLFRLGVAATEYPGGICRISLPASISDAQAKQLEYALANVA